MTNNGASTTVDYRIEEIWDGLAEFGAANIEQAMNFALQNLAQLIQAQEAFWFVGVRMSHTTPQDPVNGWRSVDVHFLDPKKTHIQNHKEHRDKMDAGQVDPSIIEALKLAGQYRVLISSEVMPKEWFESEFFKSMNESIGRQDGLFVATPIGEDVESWFAFYRVRSDNPFFAPKDAELMRLATRSLKHFHRQFLLNRGWLIASKGITASERRVLNELLTGKTTGQISEALNLSEETVKTYSARICRKFNVSGRARLQGLWLGNSG